MKRWIFEQISSTDDQRQTSLVLRALPRLPVPSDLTTRLLVVASKERVTDRLPGALLRRCRSNLRLCVDNLMKPFALPAAGGLCAAILLFMALMPTFTLNRTLGVDVPIGLFTEPALKNVKPIGFHYGDAEVDLRIDEQGRLINYSIISGSNIDGDLVRHSIENNLLFTTFTPATAFGVPITGKMRLSFRSSRIDVKG